MSRNPNHTFVIRSFSLEAEVCRQIDALAAADDRSVSNYINHHFRQLMAAQPPVAQAAIAAAGEAPVAALGTRTTPRRCSAYRKERS